VECCYSIAALPIRHANAIIAIVCDRISGIEKEKLAGLNNDDIFLKIYANHDTYE
jgi:hypothetical protein